MTRKSGYHKGTSLSSHRRGRQQCVPSREGPSRRCASGPILAEGWAFFVATTADHDAGIRQQPRKSLPGRRRSRRSRPDHRSRRPMSGRGRPGALRLSGQSRCCSSMCRRRPNGFAWDIRTAAARCSSKRSTGGWSPRPGQGKTGRAAQERRSLSLRPRRPRRSKCSLAAGIPYEVVPGVTAAFAAASHAGIPITHRDLASAVALITGHRRGDKCRPGAGLPVAGPVPRHAGLLHGHDHLAAVERGPDLRRPIARDAGGHRAPGELARPGDDPLHAWEPWPT